MRRAMLTVAALMFLAGAAGLVHGMWAEVAAARETYAGLKLGNSATFPARWSVKAAAFFVGLQTEKPTPADNTGILPPEDAGPEPAPRDTNPKHGKPVDRRPSDDPKHRHTFEPDPVDPEPKDPPPIDTAPHKTDPPKLPDKGPKPLPTGLALDKRTNALLDKAHKVFDTAWKHHLKSRPSAPARGRNAATKKAIKYFNEAKKLYQAALKRKIPADLRRKIERRLVDLNGRLYWSYKHLGMR